MTHGFDVDAMGREHAEKLDQENRTQRNAEHDKASGHRPTPLPGPLTPGEAKLTLWVSTCRGRVLVTAEEVGNIIDALAAIMEYNHRDGIAVLDDADTSAALDALIAVNEDYSEYIPD